MFFYLGILNIKLVKTFNEAWIDDHMQFVSIINTNTSLPTTQNPIPTTSVHDLGMMFTIMQNYTFFDSPKNLMNFASNTTQSVIISLNQLINLFQLKSDFIVKYFFRIKHFVCVVTSPRSTKASVFTRQISNLVSNSPQAEVFITTSKDSKRKVPSVR